VFQAVLIFVVLFWLYSGYVWLTNQVPPVTPDRRLLLIAGMGAFLVCALAIPGAFAGDGVMFGIGYLVAVLIHGGLYARGYGPDTLRFVPFNVAAALTVIIAGVFSTPVAYLFWLPAIPLQLVAAGMSARSSGLGLDFHASHFVERHGLLLLVALGESVVAIGIGTYALELDGGVVLVAVLGLAIAAGLWWAYFVGDEDAAEHALRSAPPSRRVRLAVDAYFYAFVPMLLGIIVLAAGVKLALGRPFEPLGLGPTIALAGGVALFLASDSLFRTVLKIGRPDLRLLAALAVMATVVAGLFLMAAVQLGLLVLILVALLVIEAEERKPARR
jgi:low temperature requirement protein LtrA